MIRVHAPLHTKVSTAIQLDGQTKARDVTAHFQCENRWHAFARTRTRTHAVANGVWRFYHSLCLPNISPVQYLYEVGGNICESDVIAYTHDIVAHYILNKHVITAQLTVIFFLCSCLPPRWASSPSGLRFIGGPQGQSPLWLADQTMTRTISITTCPGELLKCLTTTGVWQSGSCLTKCLTVNLASQYLFSHRTTRATKLPVLPSLNPGSETNY